MDIANYKFSNSSEKETALLFHNLGLTCVDLNWKIKGQLNNDDGEIDGIFYDEKNQLYIVYDDSTQNDRQDKVSKFLNKWKQSSNQNKLREDLQLKNYPLYVLYIDKSGKESKLHSLNYAVDDFTKIVYTEDYLYFERIFKAIGKWAKNDFYNYLNIKPRQVIKRKVNATQIYVGNTPAYVFADRVENILNYCFISRRKDNSTGYQRLVDPNRVKRIELLIKTNKISAFPNSILLNCIDEIEFLPKSKSECPCTVTFDLPDHFASCKVVDGQHRLLAFSKLESRIQDSHSLPIVLFQNMQIENEIQTFIEINDSQKGIDPNLIYSLKADLSFQVGTKEFAEKKCVEIAKKLNKDVPIFKDSVFFGNAGEQKKQKITLTTIVQSMLESKIVDSHKGFLQLDYNDVDTPYNKIKEFSTNLISIDHHNFQFYKSNNGIQLIIRFCSIIHRNIERGNIKSDIGSIVKIFSDSIKRNQKNLGKKYGKAGFNSLLSIILGDIISQSKSMELLEIDIKKLK